MKTLLNFLTICLFLIPLHYAFGQSTNGNSDPTSRENWLPNRGNVGIGTRSPSEALEVLGNVKVSQTVFTNDLETIGLKATTLNVSQDAFIGRHLLVSGNVGIGIANPTERLEISGNLKVSNSIFGDQLTVRQFTATDGSVNNSLKVGQKFIVDGVTGLGVNSPTERLEVLGNIKVTQGLYSDLINTGEGSFSRNVQVNQNLFITGNTGLGVSSPTEKLEVSGNAKVTQGIFSNSITSGDGSFSRNLKSNQNIIADGSVGVGTVNPSEKLEVIGNAKISQGLYSATINSTDGLFSGNLKVTQNSIVNGSIGIGIASPSEKLDVLGNIKSSADVIAVNIRGDKGYFSSLESNGNLTINGNVGIGVTSPSEKLEVAGNIKATQNLIANSAQITQDVTVGRNISVSGNIGLGIAPGSDKLSVAGNAYVNGLLTTENLTVKHNLDLKGTFSVAGTLGVGVASPEATLHVGGDGKFDGNIRANKIIVNSIEIAGATPSPGGDGSSVSLGDNLMVNGSVGIGTTKINGYKLSVNGKIRASDDIKVYLESEWSDFVFDKNYKLRKLDEVELYIKKHGHLPEIPSAEAVKKEGIDLGAMDAKLLQKIEELTLYMIEMKKENESLKKEVNSLKQSNNK